MKKLVFILILIVILFLGYQNRTALAAVVYQSPCESPKTYSIGSIDPRFKISKTTFLEDTEEAGSLWKNENGQPLFKYDPNSPLTINLIYDERQYLNSQIDNLNSQVDEQKDTLKPEIADYEKRAAAFKQKNADLNNQINYWNTKGGAPEDVYNKLQEDQRALQSEAQELQVMASKLNQSTDQYNTQIQQLDQKVSDYNQTLEKKPEEGLYIRDGSKERIEIYFDNSRAELIHTVAHEMGHAIGMEHVNDTEAIMYPKTTSVTQLSAADLTELAKVCRKRSIVETAGDKLGILADDLHSSLNDLMTKVTNSSQQQSQSNQ